MATSSALGPTWKALERTDSARPRRQRRPVAQLAERPRAARCRSAPRPLRPRRSPRRCTGAASMPGASRTVVSCQRMSRSAPSSGPCSTERAAPRPRSGTAAADARRRRSSPGRPHAQAQGGADRERAVLLQGTVEPRQQLRRARDELRRRAHRVADASAVSAAASTPLPVTSPMVIIQRAADLPDVVEIATGLGVGHGRQIGAGELEPGNVRELRRASRLCCRVLAIRERSLYSREFSIATAARDAICSAMATSDVVQHTAGLGADQGHRAQGPCRPASSAPSPPTASPPSAAARDGDHRPRCCAAARR